ncbi:hypothetical protein PF004_g25131 [Phytophthora fragariae]|uniref:Uncharacterized protein n=1 Tax=Phytophthora fragariae TaxID=53985 RepID=A0A6G0MTL6_9STRA|nr:hypothetical protein PF004_g25131 [Phytophthora fragariae]
MKFAAACTTMLGSLSSSLSRTHPVSPTRNVLTSMSSSLATVVRCQDLSSAVNRSSVASPPTFFGLGTEVH